jgi:hypothetical protein
MVRSATSGVLEVDKEIFLEKDNLKTETNGFGQGSDKFLEGASAKGQTNSREGLRPRLRQILRSQGSDKTLN